MYIYLSIYLSISMYIYLCISIRVYLSVYIYLCISIYAYLSMYIYLCTSIYVHLSIYLSINLSTYVYKYYIYTYHGPDCDTACAMWFQELSVVQSEAISAASEIFSWSFWLPYIHRYMRFTQVYSKHIYIHPSSLYMYIISYIII